MIYVFAGTGEDAGVYLNLGGAGKPAVIVAALDLNWPHNSLIDKCCEQEQGGGKGLHCTPSCGADLRGACRATADYSTCFSNPSPCGRNL